jgi:hypothetical protein
VRAPTRRIAALSLAFLAGVLASPFVAYAWFVISNTCKPGPGEPCDGGPLIVIGATIVLAPILGILFAIAAEFAIRSRKGAG